MAAREKKVAQHETSPGSFVAGWARQGIQSFVAAQKIIMDLAAQENALLIGMLREKLNGPGSQMGASIAGMAEKGAKNLSAVGKILLDLAAEETALAVEGVKHGLRLPAPAGTVAEVLRHRIATFVEMQKDLLDAAADQAHTIAECYREGEKPQPAAHVAEIAQRGIEGFIKHEKKFLDLAAQEVNASTKADKRQGKQAKERSEVLTDLARQGAEKYIETQKKLVELALEQLEETIKTTNEAKEGARKEAQSTWSTLTEKSMHNFVTAEKSLLELAAKRTEGMGTDKSRRSTKAHARAGRRQAAEARGAVAVSA